MVKWFAKKKRTCFDQTFDKLTLFFAKWSLFWVFVVIFLRSCGFAAIIMYIYMRHDCIVQYLCIYKLQSYIALDSWSIWGKSSHIGQKIGNRREWGILSNYINLYVFVPAYVAGALDAEEKMPQNLTLSLIRLKHLMASKTASGRFWVSAEWQESTKVFKGGCSRQKHDYASMFRYFWLISTLWDLPGLEFCQLR